MKDVELTGVGVIEVGMTGGAMTGAGSAIRCSATRVGGTIGSRMTRAAADQRDQARLSRQPVESAVRPATAAGRKPGQSWWRGWAFGQPAANNFPNNGQNGEEQGGGRRRRRRHGRRGRGRNRQFQDQQGQPYSDQRDQNRDDRQDEEDGT